MPRYVLSTVGTSLLTNQAGPLFKLLRDTANDREEDLSPDDKQKLDNRIAEQREKTLSGTVDASASSAPN